PGAGVPIVSCWYRSRPGGCVLPGAFSAQPVVRYLHLRWPDNPCRSRHDDGRGRCGYISASNESFANRSNAGVASGVVDRFGSRDIAGVRNDRTVHKSSIFFAEDSWCLSNDVGNVKTHFLRVGRRSRLSSAKESAEATVALSSQFSMSTRARSVSPHHDGVLH